MQRPDANLAYGGLLLFLMLRMLRLHQSQKKSLNPPNEGGKEGPVRKRYRKCHRASNAPYPAFVRLTNHTFRTVRFVELQAILKPH